MLQNLVVIVPGEQAEELYDALENAGACAMLLEDASAGTAEEAPLFGEPGSASEGEDVRFWHRCRITATYDSHQAAVEGALHLVQGMSYEIADVQEQDWVRQTQSQFPPIEVTPKLWIVPSWHKTATVPNLPGGAIVIELDPGLAFGTGSHPTTHMCLQWLAANPPRGQSVLDYGCGSGILAIAAAKLGAQNVMGVDIAPDAVEAAQANSRNNAAQVHTGLPDAAQGKSFDVVVANILSTPLKLLAPVIAANVRAGGHLVLSGILDSQADELIAHYAPYADLQVWRSHEGWVCLAGRAANAP
jgi:ribosomal protein L11 methyltransferase